MHTCIHIYTYVYVCVYVCVYVYMYRERDLYIYIYIYRERERKRERERERERDMKSPSMQRLPLAMDRRAVVAIFPLPVAASCGARLQREHLPMWIGGAMGPQRGVPVCCEKACDCNMLTRLRVMLLDH